MNHKTVLRVMNKYNLLSKSRRRRKWMQNCESVHKHTSYVGLYIGLVMFTAQVVVGAMVAVVSIGAVVLERLSRGNEKMFLIAHIASALALAVGLFNAIL